MKSVMQGNMIEQRSLVFIRVEQTNPHNEFCFTIIFGKSMEFELFLWHSVLKYKMYHWPSE